MKRLLSVLLISSALVSCTPIGAAITIGTTAGALAMEERGIEGAAEDLSMKASIISTWASSDLSFASDLSVIVYNAKAMIMGTVDSEKQRALAVEKAWQVEGIKEVYNEIQLKSAGGIENFAHDAWISTKLTTALTFDGQIMNINYKHEVEDGVVYVIGFAQSNAELNRFIAHAKSIEYVRRVVSHVEVKKPKTMFRSKGGTSKS